MIDRNLVHTRDNGVYDLKSDSIAAVQIKHTPSVRYIQDYHEKPSPYLIKLKGENRWRRVYNTQIGNASVMYIKTKYYNHIYCEVAVDEAVNNV